jgi:hypothetical protein
MAKTTVLECDWCGSLFVGESNPQEFWRSVCPKPGSCTAKIVSRYLPDKDAVRPSDVKPCESGAFDDGASPARPTPSL